MLGREQMKHFLTHEKLNNSEQFKILNTFLPFFVLNKFEVIWSFMYKSKE